MRLIGVFAVLCLLMWWAGTALPGKAPGAHAELVVGLLMLSGHVAGKVLSQIRLPRITGYLCVGLLMGPYVLRFLAVETVEELDFLNELAVTFIALAAGGELRIAELRDRMRSIVLGVVVQTCVAFAIVTGFMFFARSLLPFTATFSNLQVLAVSGLFGVLAVARSPSSAIAIINETKAHGPFTETALGITVAIDVLVIVLFATVVSFCEAVMPPVAAFDAVFILSLIVEILAGIGSGLLIGWGLAFYMDRTRVNLPILLLGTALLVTHLAHGLAAYLKDVHDLTLRLEPLLICVTAGFTVQNASRRGAEFIEAINAISLPVYVLFFALAGAGLNLLALQETWGLALLLVVVRAAAIFLSAYLGGRLSGDPPAENRIAGMAYLAQAGVSLGLALEVVRRFPEWGDLFVTVVVAVISINQMVGPITMKQALVRVGEAREV